MDIKEKLEYGQKIYRRTFLKLAGISSMFFGFGFPFSMKWKEADKKLAALNPNNSLLDWKTDEQGNKYFISQNIETDLVNGKRIVRAKVDGTWHEYQIREFSDEFYEWWLDEKMWYYDQLIAFIGGENDQLTIPNGGHHHPMLSTFGRKSGGRQDSDFHLNTTAKGFTILPKKEHIKYINDEINKIYQNGSKTIDLLKFKRKIYQQKDLWDRTRFATLELYTGRPLNPNDPAGPYGFSETHTFQNLRVNPVATLTYMSLFSTDGGQPYLEGLPYMTPHYEFRGICWLISYYNPDNSDYEKTIADYVNKEHSRFHGGNSDITANIFLISEQFNNTPGYQPGMGKREVPPAEYKQPHIKHNVVQPKLRMTKKERIELIKALRLSV